MSRSSDVHNSPCTRVSPARTLTRLLLQKQTLETKLTALDELLVKDYPRRSSSVQPERPQQGLALGDFRNLDLRKLMAEDTRERPPHHLVHEPSPAWIWAPTPQNSPSTEPVRADSSSATKSGEATSRISLLKASEPAASLIPTASLSDRYPASSEAASIILAEGHRHQSPSSPAARARARLAGINSDYILHETSTQVCAPSLAKTLTTVSSSSRPSITSYPSFETFLATVSGTASSPSNASSQMWSTSNGRPSTQALPSSVDGNSSLDSELSDETLTVGLPQYTPKRTLSPPTLSLVNPPGTPVASTEERNSWYTTESEAGELEEQVLADTPTSVESGFDIWDDGNGNGNGNGNDNADEMVVGSPATDMGSDDVEDNKRGTSTDGSEFPRASLTDDDLRLFLVTPRALAIAARRPSLETPSTSSSWISTITTTTDSEDSSASTMHYAKARSSRSACGATRVKTRARRQFDGYEKSPCAMRNGLLYEMACQSQEQRLERMMREVEGELEWLRAWIEEGRGLMGSYGEAREEEEVWKI